MHLAVQCVVADHLAQFGSHHVISSHVWLCWRALPGGKPNPDEAPTCHFDQLQEAVISGNSEHAQKLLDMVCQRAAQPMDSAKRDALAAIEGQGVVTWDAVRLESELEAHPSKKQKRVHKAPLQEELAQQIMEPPRRATVAQLQSLLMPKAKVEAAEGLSAVGGEAKESGGSASVEKEIEKPAGSQEQRAEPLEKAVEARKPAAVPEKQPVVEPMEAVEAEKPTAVPEKQPEPMEAVEAEKPTAVPEKQPVEPMEAVEAEQSAVVKALKARQKPPAPFKSRGDVSSYLYIDRWMCEPIAVESIHAFGKLRAAGQLNLRPTLSEFLARDVRGTGHVWSVYRACGTARQMGFQGRMYSGFHQHLYDELLKKEVSQEQRSSMTPGGQLPLPPASVRGAPQCRHAELRNISRCLHTAQLGAKPDSQRSPSGQYRPVQQLSANPPQLPPKFTLFEALGGGQGGRLPRVGSAPRRCEEVHERRPLRGWAFPCGGLQAYPSSLQPTTVRVEADGRTCHNPQG